MRTDSPMSKTKISLPEEIVAASITSRQASGMVMKKRVMAGCVTVTGPPRSICSRKRGMTEPFDPRTLPKRVVTNCVHPPTRPRRMACPSDWT